MASESEGGNVGKYQRLKGGKKQQRKAEDTVSSGRTRKRNVDMLCRKLSLKCHLLLSLSAHRMRSQESKKERVF